MLDPASLAPEHRQQLLKMAQTELKSVRGVMAIKLGDQCLHVFVRDPLLGRKLPRLYRQVVLRVILEHVAGAGVQGPI